MKRITNQFINNDEKCLNADTLRDIGDMVRECPAIGMARESFLAKAIGEPFSFSIPAIGIVSNKDMEKIIRARWLPFLRKVYDWCQYVGVCPYYFVKLEGTEHKIPKVPEMDLGYVTVSVTAKHELEWNFYWSHGTVSERQKDMLWIVTERHPSKDGTINSPLASLLPSYSSLLKVKKAQDIAVVQRARPVHIMEHVRNNFGDRNDDLTHTTADFGAKAAGISKARREAMIQQNIRVKTAELQKQLQAAHNANTMKSTLQPTLWTETPEDTLEEMDAGFGNRVVITRQDFKYREAAKPDIVVDYYKAETQFNTMAAAVMGFSMELLTPVGNSRSQNVQGALDFENGRIRTQCNFFVSVLESALVIAYREQFRQVMDDARNWRISRLGGDPDKVAVLFPELDVQIDMSPASMTTYDELKAMHMDGLITKETMGMHLFKNKNLPFEEMVTLQWPDKVPKEMLVKQGKEKPDRVPPKKKLKAAD
ncbi:MAG: hypothetical protein K2Q45_06815 [Nitrosomonas sp.]|nr:hypothetical protein [Nitrosomonas sp.]